MIDERFCAKIGTDKQHSYICYLLSRKGVTCLRYAAAEYLGVSVSKMSRAVVSVKTASEWIDKLLDKE